MILYGDADTGVLSLTASTTTPVAGIEEFLYNTLTLDVILHRGGTPFTVDPGVSGAMVIKEEDAFSAASLVPTTAWQPPAEQGGGYRFQVPLAGDALAALFTTGVNTKDLKLEILWGPPDQTLGPITLRVRRRYFLPDEPEVEMPDTSWPLPGNILTKAGNLEGLADPAIARMNLGITPGAFIREVTAPGADDTPGLKGDFAFDGEYVVYYIGDGDENHAWLWTPGTQVKPT